MSDQSSLNENEFSQNNVDQDLKNIDSALSELEPDFLSELNGLKIDNNSISNLSVLGSLSDLDELSLKEKLLQLLDIRNNPYKVIGFWISVILIMSALFFLYKTQFWFKNSSLFMTSFAQLNPDVQEYNPLVDVQYFFDNPNIPKNLFALKKMMINLKPTALTSDNPMLALEINVEGLNKEVVVELKDREGEFADRILRIAEEFTYEELSETAGKKNLSEKIFEDFNSNLTQGQIRKVMYNNFLLKN